VATLVCFHAHPDDEAMATGGVMAKAASAGHRVVLVTATRGEHGEVAPGVLRDGEMLWMRRESELAKAAAVLGVARSELLGYVDSGMAGAPENKAPQAFCRVAVEEAAARLAAILDAERADVLTVYDEHGTYGHPDHIQVHRVGVRAAELAGTPKVYEATLDRDYVVPRLMTLAAIGGPDGEEARALLERGMGEIGSPGAAITTRVDVRGVIDKKRAALRAHASQVGPESFFSRMPDEVFAEAFGTEWFILRGAPGGTREDDLFAGLVGLAGLR